MPETAESEESQDLNQYEWLTELLDEGTPESSPISEPRHPKPPMEVVSEFAKEHSFECNEVLTKLLHRIFVTDRQRLLAELERVGWMIERKRLRKLHADIFHYTGANYDPERPIVETAKLIRSEIKRVLSNLKVSVRCEKAGGGCSTLCVTVKTEASDEEMNKICEIVEGLSLIHI